MRSKQIASRCWVFLFLFVMYVLFSMFSTSVEFGRYWRPFSVFIALKNSPPSSSTILTPLTPSNYSADLLPEDWFHNAGKLLCWPTFAGVRSPSGFVFTYIKLSRRLIWLLACGENKTQVIHLSSFAGGFLMTDFISLGSVCVNPRLLASDLLLALCLHI